MIYLNMSRSSTLLKKENELFLNNDSCLQNNRFFTCIFAKINIEYPV